MKSADEIIEQAGRTRLASDCFDIAISGWADLIAEGDFAGADRLQHAISENWERNSRAHPAWAEQYLAS